MNKQFEWVYPKYETLSQEAFDERLRCLEIASGFKMINIDYNDPKNKDYVRGMMDAMDGIAFGIKNGLHKPEDEE